MPYFSCQDWNLKIDNEKECEVKLLSIEAELVLQ